MATNSNKNNQNTQPRILNKRATYDYAIEERYEAGLVLHGWEVKSVRAGRAQINLAHIYIRDGELFLCNAHMNPADQACTHETLETNRTRKLLMHRREIMKLIGRVERQSYTLVPLNLHFKTAASRLISHLPAASGNMKSAMTKARRNGSASRNAS